MLQRTVTIANMTWRGREFSCYPKLFTRRDGAVATRRALQAEGKVAKVERVTRWHMAHYPVLAELPKRPYHLVWVLVTKADYEPEAEAEPEGGHGL